MIIFRRGDGLKFLREYKSYQIYKTNNREIASSDNMGSSRLIKNDIIIFLPDIVIELGNEIKSFEDEKEAIEYIDSNPYTQEKFKSAMERAEQENERQDRLRKLKEDERLKYDKRKRLNYEDEISNSKY